jgi:hypothetical protein
MRRSYEISSAAGVGLALALAATAMQSSCFFTFDIDDCSQYPSAKCFDGGSGADGGDGGEGGPPPSCIPSENVSAVPDMCGVFVSSSKGNDMTGKGTQAAPYATLAKALAVAKGKPVYACGEAFTEALSITEGATLFGALDCGHGWTYKASTRTQLTAGANMIPMTLASMASGTAVHDFAITSADASAMGGSSIAVLDSQADLTLDNVDVVAGMGAPGAPGMAQQQVTTPSGAQGGNGMDDAMCNMSTIIAGGAGGTNTCSGMMTNGGNGGKGLPGSTGDDGTTGLPMMMTSNGGAGQSTTQQCQPGQQGAQGSAGMSGTGARGIGSVSAAGYQGPTGALGGAGNPGQGGGGGGAALACDAPMDTFSGPSGGGGGAGGCGGAAGNLGQSGGSSIGILVLSANLTLMNVTITANGGGAGGLGGNGQKGAAGGQPGTAGGANACIGGPGGQGGTGGPGGGGAGGHSVGIAIDGGSLPDLGTSTINATGAGTGGSGGNMDMTAQTKGDDGKACKTLDFGKPMSPTACAM